MAAKPAILYGFWLSSCTWRVRAALHLKQILYEEHAVDIAKAKRQFTEQFKNISPSQKVPALFIDDITITESMAILQYIEETRPQPSLTADTPLLGARVREICETIVSGIQPLQNIGLKSHFPNEKHYQEFAQYSTARGLETLEDLVQKCAGRYCVGDKITLADLCLVPQVYNAVTRLNLPLQKYPRVSILYETLIKEELFLETHPKNIKQKIKKSI